jgi:hypothetical protein
MVGILALQQGHTIFGRNKMRNALLAAVAALTLAAPAAAQTSQDLNMPVAPPLLGERLGPNTQTFEPAYDPAGFQVDPSQLSAAQVRQLQQSLRAQGFPVTRVDGRFGPETAGAMQSFQQRQGIPSPPGQVDTRALGMLGVGVAAAAPSGPAPTYQPSSSGLSTPLAGSATRRR